MSVSRNLNAFYLSIFCPDTLVEEHLRFPFGAPIMSGLETELKNGAAAYRLPNTTSRECRVFVEQAQPGVVTCHEVCSVYTGISRRLLVTGLKDADVTFFPETGSEKRLEILPDPQGPYLEGNFIIPEFTVNGFGTCVKLKNISGPVMFSW